MYGVGAQSFSRFLELIGLRFHGCFRQSGSLGAPSQDCQGPHTRLASFPYNDYFGAKNLFCPKSYRIVPRLVQAKSIRSSFHSFVRSPKYFISSRRRRPTAGALYSVVSLALAHQYPCCVSVTHPPPGTYTFVHSLVRIEQSSKPWFAL